MKTPKVYLKQNVFLEPLINQWYAWSYLISPATSAMYIANLHLKIMQSFIAAPQVHVAALKNPAMIGGPFINYDASKVYAIKDLLEKTKKDQAHMLEFAESIKTLDKKLRDEAKGHSLENFYQYVPESLKGYVELTYDLNNNPSIRLIEGLLYRSKYYDIDSQSIALSITGEDKRDFIFSTPRLEDENYIFLNLPFLHEGIDNLFRMKTTSQSLHEIAEMIGVDFKDYQRFSYLFTEKKPITNFKYEGDDVRIRYLGHACILLESKNTTILLDPVISYQHDSGIDRYTFADLPPYIDYVLITHNHQDHCMLETLLQLRHKIKNLIVPKSNGGTLADPSLKLLLEKIGFKNVIELDEMEAINTEDGLIMGLPFLGEHADLNIKTKLSYWIHLKSKSILGLADSNNLENKLYYHIHEIVGDVDVLFIGMECDGGPLSWLYGSLLTKPLPRDMDQSRRFSGSDYEKAIEIIKHFQPKQVYVYAMGQEPWLTYLTSIQYTEQSRPIIESNKLVADCHSQGVVAERLFGKREILLGQK